jgi:hypothetical protein
MADAKTYRKRQRRGQRPIEAGAAAEPGAGRRTAVSQARWEWLTFPVFFAFVCGGFLILLLYPDTNTWMYTTLFALFAGALFYGLLHMAVRWWLLRRRR